MLNLIKRDLILQKKHLIFYIPFIILFVAVGKHPAFVFVISSIFIPFNAYAYDEKAETNILLNSLPYTRKQIVSARYIGAILFMILSIIISILLLQLFGRTFTITDILIGIGLFILFAAIGFPMFYIFKPGHITTVLMVSFILLAIFAPMLYNYIIEVSLISNLMNELTKTSLVTFATILVVMIYSLSWLFTLLVYQKKAF